MGSAELPQLAVLVSRDGTTLESLYLDWQYGILKAGIGMVITNNRNAGVINRVKRLNRLFHLNVPCKIVNNVRFPAATGEKVRDGGITAAAGKMLAELCRPYDHVLLSGWNKRLSGPLLKRKPWNHHPGPVPLTAGMMMEECAQAALDAGYEYTELLFHEVAGEDYDQDKILFRQPIPILRGSSPEEFTDTAATLNNALRAVEKRCLPFMINSGIHGDLYPPMPLVR